MNESTSKLAPIPSDLVIIVQAPVAWRHKIEPVLSTEEVSIPVDLREETSEPTIHQSRREDYYAAQALSLTTENAHQTDAITAAIICYEAEDQTCVIMAVHQQKQTVLHRWNTGDVSGAIDHVSFLVQNTSAHESQVQKTVPHSRYCVRQADLFTVPLSNQSLWCLSKEHQFVPSQPVKVSGILSGSFDPLHAGHVKMKQVAEKMLGGQVLYEVTLQNADKPPLDYLSLKIRTQQFAEGQLLLTQAPTFVEKASLFPGATFVLGWDTAVRVLDRRFYPEGQVESSLESILGRGCHFLVAARRAGDQLRKLEDLPVPRRFRELFSPIPSDEFEDDISSSMMREAWLRGESEIGPPALSSLIA